MKNNESYETFIPEFPQLNVNCLFKRRRTRNFFEEFYGKDAILFGLGRGAIWQAIKLLQLKRTDKVLVPSYHCSVDIEPILESGVRFEYYKVHENFNIDINDILSRIDIDSKVIFIIHYYGFSQPVEYLRNLCKEKEIFLIEDCAHALFSTYRGVPLGTYGDVSVFSQRKTLPIPDGGALLVNNPGLSQTVFTRGPNKIVALKAAVGIIVNQLENTKNNNLVSILLKILKQVSKYVFFKKTSNEYSDSLAFDISMASIGISNISKKIMRSINTKEVINKRRENYIYILEHIRSMDKVKILFDSLPEGVCPLFFPVQVVGRERRQVQDLMLKNGIKTYVFGEELHHTLPKHEYPVAEKLSREVLCLPIHQNLNLKDLSYMLNILKYICHGPFNVKDKAREC